MGASHWQKTWRARQSRPPSHSHKPRAWHQNLSIGLSCADCAAGVPSYAPIYQKQKAHRAHHALTGSALVSAWRLWPGDDYSITFLWNYCDDFRFAMSDASPRLRRDLLSIARSCSTSDSRSSRAHRQRINLLFSYSRDEFEGLRKLFQCRTSLVTECNTLVL